MKELIQQYIEDSSSLISKQAEEIKSLKEKARQSETEGVLVKKAAEDLLDDLANCLDNGQYTMDSVAKAIRNRDTACLEKEAIEEDVDDNSWGQLDGHTVDSLNIRPSERKLYKRMGLI